MSSRSCIVLDNGTGFTKMGYAGNTDPSFSIPTAVATAEEGSGGVGGREGISDLDFYVGDDAIAHSKTHQLNYPIRHGLVDNWNNMERLWQRCFYDYLRVEPDEHYVLLTEPPLNPPENREYTAEVMFETFNVPGMYIAVQAVLALAASWITRDPKDRVLTGTVVDSGDGVTHVIPVVDGYVIGSSIRHIPLAGRDITQFVQRSLRDRGEAVPPEDALEVAKKVKEQHCYISQDIVKEYGKFDEKPEKYIKKFTGRHSRTRAEYSVDVGYESFLGPELFFNPEIYSSDFCKPLPEIVDEAILTSPIDARRSLYRNIVLSGGSTMFHNFDKRLQMDIKDRVNARMDANIAKLRIRPDAIPQELKVKVISHPQQRYAVWFGGSMLASMPEFGRTIHTKAQYMEEGPRIARHNPVFSAQL